MRVALIGHGFIGSVHARNLKAAGVTLSAVCGPDLAEAEAFASSCGAETAVADLTAALVRADAALIASPSGFHFQQARQVIARGIPVLIELPASASLEEAETLAAAAAAAKVVLRCCHTSLYMEPHRRIGEWIRSGRLGAILQVNYFRSVKLKPRAWIDDALWHHAGHPVDLLLDWFGEISAADCAVGPAAGPPQDAALLARLPGGGPITIALSYTAKWITSRMTVVGADHTVSTDGYSVIESDHPDFAWRGEAETIFDRAVGEQDRAFLDCCRAGSGGIPWRETLRQLAFLEKMRQLSEARWPIRLR